MKGGVYKISNIINNKIYIGSAVDFERRKKQHFRQLFNNEHFNYHLQRAFNKYGVDNFIFEIIEECEEDQCVIKEQFYIDKLNATNPEFGYNISPTAGSVLGVKRSDETKRKLSQSHIGLKDSEQTRLKKIAKLTGRFVSEETKEKMRINNLGKKMSKDACLKISEAGKGRIMSQEHRKAISIGRDIFNKTHPSRIKVSQYDKDGHYIQTFDSVKLAALATNAKPSHVSRCLLGTRKSTKGFIFKYA